MRKLLVTSLLLFCTVAAHGAVFATERLWLLAQCMQLHNLDTLQVASSSEAYSFRLHPLIIRTNAEGQVDHIGILLFNKEMRTIYHPQVCDFLERDLLERLLPNLNDSLRHFQRNEHVVFHKGTPQTALTLDDTDEFSLEQFEMKSYRAIWRKDSQIRLSISFDMDCQLLLGCNAIQLEEQFMRRLRNYQNDITSASTKISANINADTYVTDLDTFLVSQMRNELFYERDDNGHWNLATDKSAPTKLLGNMMLGTAFGEDLQLSLTFSKYGNQTEKLMLPYNRLIQFCIHDGCQPYFGIKSKDADGYHGTLLMVNKSLGYTHIMSVTVPHSVITKGGKGTVIGTLYVYTPLHNVANHYFN